MSPPTPHGRSMTKTPLDFPNTYSIHLTLPLATQLRQLPISSYNARVLLRMHLMTQDTSHHHSPPPSHPHKFSHENTIPYGKKERQTPQSTNPQSINPSISTPPPTRLPTSHPKKKSATRAIHITHPPIVQLSNERTFKLAPVCNAVPEHPINCKARTHTHAYYHWQKSSLDFIPTYRNPRYSRVRERQ